MVPELLRTRDTPNLRRRRMSLVARVATTAIPDALNIADYLVARHVREGRGARIALMTADGPITYSELDALVNRAGNVLRGIGVAPEHRIVLLLHDGPAFYASFLGAKYPRWIEFIVELPKTATGKLQRFRLR
jgi:acyl-coenzyme A synthetase/AMP-(fatty) acid ligase